MKELTPHAIWNYFMEICQIARPSKNEGKIVAYLLDFARKHDLTYKQDAAGNLVITKPATRGREGAPGLILQSHVDMVCEKNHDVNHDFLTDPIKPEIDGDWVIAKGTTLGADNGIGVATQLAILADKNLEHGLIECLFTVDEESGLTGANNLGDNLLTGATLINLDSEEEDDIFIGCAGGIDTIGYLRTEFEQTPANSFGLTFRVYGLKGGHSGDDIHKGLGNANKILCRWLALATRELDFRLHSIDGGNLRNAIAREARAVGIIPANKKEDAAVLTNCLAAELLEELGENDPGLQLKVESCQAPDTILTRDINFRLLNMLQAMPHGVLAMSNKIPGLVETSTNLASVKMNDNEVIITTSQRSSLESSKINASEMVKSLMLLANAKIWQSAGYPGWQPNTNSRILQIAVNTYENLHGKSPGIKAIHAGLECGLFLKKYPGLEMISIGPTIKGAHSPHERVEIASVQKFWTFLLEIMKSYSNP